MDSVLRYSALASDYDGTLALDGCVPDTTLDALGCFKEAGGVFILVTGRDLEDLRSVFPQLDICDLVVAENGALLYDPATGNEQLLGPGVPAALLTALAARDVTPILPGRAIVSTRQPHENTVVEVILSLGLPYHTIFNKGAVMLLPAGINKGTGISAALARLHLSRETVVAVGDAENDHSLLAGVGLGVAVANALESLRDEADVVLSRPASAGVTELIEMLLAGDPRLVRRGPSVGKPVSLPVAAAEESVPGTR